MDQSSPAAFVTDAESPEAESFRQEVREFVAGNLPAQIEYKMRHALPLDKDDMRLWQTALFGRGWLAPHWPVEYGGTGWSALQRAIYEDEACTANAPRVAAFGVSMLGPVIIKYGTEEQKRFWLPRILDGTDWWCQGYSEPGSGSDLASIRTHAVRDGDYFVVNGQKTWTTYGQYADKIFVLVRTDRQATKQNGITFLLVDMQSPGIEVRPIITLDGDHEVNDVFFTDVRVPVANVVGEIDKGWTCAKYLLSYERTSIAGIGVAEAALRRLLETAADVVCGKKRLIDDPLFAARLGRVSIQLECLRTTNLRLASSAAGNTTGVEASILKIRGSEIRQEISSLWRRAMGSHAQAWEPEMLDVDYGGFPPPGPADAMAASAYYFNNRKLSIYGGSNEIQRNIMSKIIF